MRFVRLGLTPLEALVTATSGAAELLGVGDRTGRIAEGYEADLILLEHDPLEDPAALQDVLMVMTNGRVALNRLPFGLPNN
jgi:imidazolonepropionase-like amidohydrolase